MNIANEASFFLFLNSNVEVYEMRKKWATPFSSIAQWKTKCTGKFCAERNSFEILVLELCSATTSKSQILRYVRNFFPAPMDFDNCQVVET